MQHHSFFRNLPLYSFVINMIILRAVVRKSGDIQNVRKIVKDPMSGREAVTVDKVLGRVPSVKFVSLGNVDVLPRL